MVDKAIMCKKCGDKGLTNQEPHQCSLCGGEQFILPYTVEEYLALTKEEEEELYEKFNIHPLISYKDASDISCATNHNYAVVDAMIELKQKDIIEYELKMQQFREAAKQVRLAKEEEENTIKCPRCGSTNIQMVPRKFSLLTGFMTNKVDRVCMNCKHKF